MTTPCIGCRRPIPVGSGGRCRECQNPARRIRSGRAWRILSSTVRDRGVCARCGTRTGPFQANHITPLGTDPRSVAAECVCLPCHVQITNAQRVDRVM